MPRTSAKIFWLGAWNVTIGSYDSGSAIEGVNVKAQVPALDLGISSSSMASTAYVLMFDSASGIEAYILQGKVSASDLGTSTETYSLRAHLGFIDHGVASDLIVASYYIAVTDAAAGYDAAFETKSSLYIADRAKGTETYQLQTSLSITDYGVGAEIRILATRARVAVFTLNGEKETVFLKQNLFITQLRGTRKQEKLTGSGS